MAKQKSKSLSLPPKREEEEEEEEDEERMAAESQHHYHQYPQVYVRLTAWNALEHAKRSKSMVRELENEENTNEDTNGSTTTLQVTHAHDTCTSEFDVDGVWWSSPSTPTPTPTSSLVDPMYQDMGLSQVAREFVGLYDTTNTTTNHHHPHYYSVTMLSCGTIATDPEAILFGSTAAAAAARTSSSMEQDVTAASERSSDDDDVLVVEEEDDLLTVPTDEGIITNTNRRDGLVTRFVQEVFQTIQNDNHSSSSSSSVPAHVECTVRLSMVELHLEQWWDLIRVQGGEDDDDKVIWVDTTTTTSATHDPLQGTSEVCCLTLEDALQALQRGLARRRNNTYSSQSHLMVQLRLESLDRRRQGSSSTRVSHFRLVHLAGTEHLTTTPPTTTTSTTSSSSSKKAKKNKQLQESKMIQASLSSVQHYLQARKLEAEVAATTANKDDDDDGEICIPKSGHYAQVSQLTKYLHAILSMSQQHKVIALISASPASISITDTLQSLQLLHPLRSLPLLPLSSPSSSLSLQDRAPPGQQQQQQHHQQHHLMQLCQVLAMEAKAWRKHGHGKLSDNAWDVVAKFAKPSNKDQIWKDMTRQLEEFHSSSTKDSSTDADDPKATIQKLQEQLQQAQQEKERAESRARDYKSQWVTMQAQLERLELDNVKWSTKYQTLQDSYSELESIRDDLQSKSVTSQFREREAVVFLRQFRGFYMRLLKSKLVGGGGDDGLAPEGHEVTVNDVIQDLPGVADLKDLLDVDRLLIQSGLIESKQAGREDPSTLKVPSSDQALQRSHNEAHAALQKLHGNEIVQQQRLAETPAGKLAIQKEAEMDEQIVSLSKKYAHLQIALAAEKNTVETLAARQGAAGGAWNKLKAATEINTIRAQLQRRSMDLQAIVWKMNELHMINTTMNDRMERRESHLSHLEEELQTSKHQRDDSLRHLQQELQVLQKHHSQLQSKLKDATTPLWQLGEARMPVNRHHPPRIIVPSGGGEVFPVPTSSSKTSKKKSKISLDDIAQYGIHLLEPPTEKKVLTQTGSQTETAALVDAEMQTEPPESCHEGTQTESPPTMTTSGSQTDPIEVEHKEEKLLDTTVETQDTSIQTEISGEGTPVKNRQMASVSMQTDEAMAGDTASSTSDSKLNDSDASLENLSESHSNSNRSTSARGGTGGSLTQNSIQSIGSISNLMASPLSSPPKAAVKSKSITFQTNPPLVEEPKVQERSSTTDLKRLGASMSALEVSTASKERSSQREYRSGMMDSQSQRTPRLGGSMSILDETLPERSYRTTRTLGTTNRSKSLVVDPNNTNAAPEWMQKLKANKPAKEPEKPEWMKKLKSPKPTSTVPWMNELQQRKPTETPNAPTTEAEPEFLQKRRTMGVANAEEEGTHSSAHEEDDDIPVVAANTPEWKQRFEEIGLKNQVEIVAGMDSSSASKSAKPPSPEWKAKYKKIGRKNHEQEEES